MLVFAGGFCRGVGRPFAFGEWDWVMGLRLACPLVDELSGYAHFARQGRKLTTAEEARVDKLLLLNLDLASGVLRDETDHEARREGPWLATPILYVCDFETRLLTDLAADALLEALSHLDKARHEPIVVVAEIAGTDHEYLILSSLDSDDDGRRDGGVGLVAALGAFFGYVGEWLKRRAALGTEAALLIPKDHLFGLASRGEGGMRHGEEERPEVFGTEFGVG